MTESALERLLGVMRKLRFEGAGRAAAVADWLAQ